MTHSEVHVRQHRVLVTCAVAVCLAVRCGGEVGGASTSLAADASAQEAGSDASETGGQAGQGGAQPPAGAAGGGQAGGEPTAGGAGAGHVVPTNTAYHLVQTRALAAPLPGATGITYDGEELWLLAPNEAAQSGDLIRFNPDTLVVDRSFTLAPLYATLGTQTNGITWDGTSIWVSVAGDTNLLALLDPVTGAVLKKMSSPSELGPVDLDFDGTNLWLSDGIGTEYRMDPSNGGVLKHFALIQLRDNGNAYRGGELFIGDLFGCMELYDAASGGSLGLVLHDDGSPVTESGPSVFVGDQLVVLSNLGITYYQTVKSP